MEPRKPRSKREENALKWRAVAAFAKYARPDELRAPYDDTRVTVVEARDHLGEVRSYVVITAGNRRIAVFRVRADGQLKRMRRPPRELQTSDE